jgi:hypothetical protein
MRSTTPRLGFHPVHLHAGGVRLGGRPEAFALVVYVSAISMALRYVRSSGGGLAADAIVQLLRLAILSNRTFTERRANALDELSRWPCSLLPPGAEGGAACEQGCRTSAGVAKQAKLKHTPKGAIARDPRPLAWGEEPRLRAHPTHYLAHTPLPQRMEGGGYLLFFVCFCPEAKNSFRVIRFVDPEPLDSRISQRV